MTPTSWRSRFLRPIHRGWGVGIHRAHWVLSDALVENPWWNIRWLMDMQECTVCGYLHTRYLARSTSDAWPK